jgi:hypothetical protein
LYLLMRHQPAVFAWIPRKGPRHQLGAPDMMEQSFVGPPVCFPTPIFWELASDAGAP